MADKINCRIRFGHSNTNSTRPAVTRSLLAVGPRENLERKISGPVKSDRNTKLDSANPDLTRLEFQILNCIYVRGPHKSGVPNFKI